MLFMLILDFLFRFQVYLSQFKFAHAGVDFLPKTIFACSSEASKIVKIFSNIYAKDEVFKSALTLCK